MRRLGGVLMSGLLTCTVAETGKPIEGSVAEPDSASEESGYMIPLRPAASFPSFSHIVVPGKGHRLIGGLCSSMNC